VPQPEAVAEAILERCERRSLLRHFAVADFEETSDFLTSFARANSLPEPKLIGGASGLVDARAAALGLLRYVMVGKLPFCTPAPPAPPGGALAALPESMVASGWRVKGAPTASAAAGTLSVEMRTGEPDEIDLEEPEEEQDFEGDEEEGDDDEDDEEEGDDEEDDESVDEMSDDDDDE